MDNFTKNALSIARIIIEDSFFLLLTEEILKSYRDGSLTQDQAIDKLVDVDQRFSDLSGYTETNNSINNENTIEDSSIICYDFHCERLVTKQNIFQILSINNEFDKTKIEKVGNKSFSISLESKRHDGVCKETVHDYQFATLNSIYKSIKLKRITVDDLMSLKLNSNLLAIEPLILFNDGINASNIKDSSCYNGSIINCINDTKRKSSAQCNKDAACETCQNYVSNECEELKPFLISGHSSGLNSQDLTIDTYTTGKGHADIIIEFEIF